VRPTRGASRRGWLANSPCGAGETAPREAVLPILVKHRQPDGSIRSDNTFRYLVRRPDRATWHVSVRWLQVNHGLRPQFYASIPA
jgi:hypothetical protein